MIGCGKGVWLPYAECYSPCGHGGEFCAECAAELDAMFTDEPAWEDGESAATSGGVADTLLRRGQHA